MDIAMKEGTYSKTHQVFIRTDKNTMNRIFENKFKINGITLN